MRRRVKLAMARFSLSQSDRQFESEPTSATSPLSNFEPKHLDRELGGLFGYICAVLGVVFATATLRILRPYLDAGDESLLYLPVVIVCAFKFGFGPAVAASIFSFGCWDYFFDVPYYALTISNAHDCISLAMYLVVAVTTAHLAARAKARRQVSEARESAALPGKQRVELRSGYRPLPFDAG